MDIDFDRTVFVIDTPITALVVAIIAENHEINCIIERKIDFFDEKYYKISEMILSNIKMKSFQHYIVPQPFFLLDRKRIFKTFSRLINFKKQIKHVTLENDKIYVGASTSSVMSIVYPEQRKLYIDHGTGDYFYRMFMSTRGIHDKKSLKKFLRYQIFRLLRFPDQSFSNRVKGFTLCKMKNDNFKWLDYRKFHSEFFQELLRDVIDATYSRKKNVLLLATSDFHKEDGVSGDTTIFDELNIELVKRNISKDEKVFIKFHPTLALANETTVELIGKLISMGYDAVDVNNLIPGNLGIYIPSEILLNYCNFTKIVCEESSLLWNVSHIETIELFSDVYLFENHFNQSRKSKYTIAMNGIVENKAQIPALSVQFL